MTTDTNPPVGARITVEGVTWEFHATVPCAHWADVVTGRAANFDHHCALNALWRMQQRAKQAEATRDLVTLDNIRLVAELAKLRALAVEAKALLATESYRTAKQPAAHLLFRLAALATPNQEPRHE